MNEIKEVANSSHTIEAFNTEAFKGEVCNPERKLLDVYDHEKYMKSFETRAHEKPLYQSHESRIRRLRNEIGPALHNVEGYRSVLEKTLSNKLDSARGFFAELINATRAYRAGLNIQALDKTAYSESGKKTDIDLYAITPGGKRIVFENKDCKSGISMTSDFKRKIDLISQDLYDKRGNIIPKDAAVFINSKHISKPAMQYAIDKGVHIKKNMDGRARERYYQNLAAKLDSE